MKKITAIILSAIMIVLSCPFIVNAAVPQQIDTAAEFMAVSDGHYVLGADIDLTSVNWTTISEFSGVLNGNGHKITVPSNAPIFDTVTGTVKNLKLDGTVTLDASDASDIYIGDACKSYPVGPLANRTVGGTFENIYSTVNVNFTNGTRPNDPSSAACGVSVGGLIGFACGAYSISETNYLTITENATIKNVVVSGTMNVNYNVGTHGRDNVGGILGVAFGGVDVMTSMSDSTVTVTNSTGNKGGLIGYVHNAYYVYNGNTLVASKENSTLVIQITDCMFSGNWTVSGTVGERFGGIVGYGRGLAIKSCVNEGRASGSGTIVGILGYANTTDHPYFSIVDGCIAVGASGCGTYMVHKCSAGCTGLVTNMYVVQGNTVNGVTIDENYPTDNVTYLYNTTYNTKDEARRAFVANNSDVFEYANGVIAMKNATDFDFVLKNDKTFELSTGIASETGKASDVPYAGYIQFAKNAEGKTLARIVMVVTEEEYNNPDYDAFAMKVTVGGNTVTLNSRAMAVFQTVSAAGTQYTAADGYRLFGVVIAFDQTPDAVTVALEGPGAVTMYKGSASPSNIDIFQYVTDSGSLEVMDWATLFGS